MATEEFLQAQSAVLAAWGVEARSRFVAVPGGRAHVLVGGEGPAVVLVNGVGTPAAMWAPLMARLGGLKLFALDLPGFGLTELAAPKATRLREDMTRFLAHALDALELRRPMFVANSLGSLCVLWLALDRPSRVGPMAHVGCPALVLGTAAPLPMRLLSLRGVGRILEALRPPSLAQVQGLARMVREHPLPPEIADLLVATERLPGFARVFRPTLRRLLRLRGARPEAALKGEELSRVSQPVALVWGADDPFGSPAVGARAVELMKDAEFHVVPGGHVPWVHHAGEVAAHVAPFLRRHSAPAPEAATSRAR